MPETVISPSRDRPNQKYSFQIRRGEIERFEHLKKVKFSKGRISEHKDPVSRIELPQLENDKIHPEIDAFLKSEGLEDSIRAIVTLKRDAELPRFARLDTKQPIESSFNNAVKLHNENLADQIIAVQRGLQDEVAELLGLELNSRFWISNSFETELSRDQIRKLRRMKVVQYIDPVLSQDKAPSSGPNGMQVMTIEESRQILNSDQLFVGFGADGTIALLDTGVDIKHKLVRDAITTNYEYTQFPASNIFIETRTPSDNLGHGTPSASIISGSDEFGQGSRGLTAMSILSFDVYYGLDTSLNYSAATRAFERAVLEGVGVIAANISGDGNYKSVLSKSADGAMESGTLVIAANGNNRGLEEYSVSAPANGRGSMGLGCYEIVNSVKVSVSAQSIGPTFDRRIKPEFRCPTNTWCAESRWHMAPNDEHCDMALFNNTSGSMPYGAAIAGLCRNLIASKIANYDPGYIYSLLLGFCHPGTDGVNNLHGAGDILLPDNYSIHFGKVNFTTLTTLLLDIDLFEPNPKRLTAVLWWYSPYIEELNDIDLELIEPSGQIAEISHSNFGVFEHLTHEPDSIQDGPWQLKIIPFDLPNSQEVYWLLLETTS